MIIAQKIGRNKMAIMLLFNGDFMKLGVFDQGFVDGAGISHYKMQIQRNSARINNIFYTLRWRRPISPSAPIASKTAVAGSGTAKVVLKADGAPPAHSRFD